MAGSNTTIAMESNSTSTNNQPIDSFDIPNMFSGLTPWNRSSTRILTASEKQQLEERRANPTAPWIARLHKRDVDLWGPPSPIRYDDESDEEVQTRVELVENTNFLRAELEKMASKEKKAIADTNTNIMNAAKEKQSFDAKNERHILNPMKRKRDPQEEPEQQKEPAQKPAKKAKIEKDTKPAPTNAKKQAKDSKPTSSGSKKWNQIMKQTRATAPPRKPKAPAPAPEKAITKPETPSKKSSNTALPSLYAMKPAYKSKPSPSTTPDAPSPSPPAPAVHDETPITPVDTPTPLAVVNEETPTTPAPVENEEEHDPEFTEEWFLAALADDVTYPPAGPPPPPGFEYSDEEDWSEEE